MLAAFGEVWRGRDGVSTMTRIPIVENRVSSCDARLRVKTVKGSCAGWLVRH
jgi:hypothetical protein